MEGVKIRRWRIIDKMVTEALAIGSMVLVIRDIERFSEA